MMSVVLASEPMARVKGRPRKPSGEGTLVRIDSDIVDMARWLSARSGTPISEMFSDILRPGIERLFAKGPAEVVEAQKRTAEDAAAEAQARKTGDIFADDPSPPKGKRKGAK